MLALVAEQARHTAAAAVERLDGRAGRQLQRRDGGRGADERLLMAVGVQDDVSAGTELGRIELQERLLEQARGGSHPLHARIAGEQACVVVADREDAARLQPRQRDTAAGEGIEHREVALGVAAGVVDEPLAEHRAPAADDLGEHDARAGGGEQPDGVLADLRALVVRPRVVEEGDLGPVALRQSGEARRERRRCDARQPAPAVDPAEGLGGATRQAGGAQRVDQPGA